MVRERENQGGVRGRICRCEVRRQTKEKGGSEDRLYKGEKESKRVRENMQRRQKDKRCKNRGKAGGRDIKGRRVSCNHTYCLPRKKRLSWSH